MSLVQRSKPSSPLLITRWQFPKAYLPLRVQGQVISVWLFVCPLPLGFWSNILSAWPPILPPTWSHRLPSTPATVCRDLPKSAPQPQSSLTLVNKPSRHACICVHHSYSCLTFLVRREDSLFRVLLFLHIHAKPQPVWRAFALHKNLFLPFLRIRISTSFRITVDPSVELPISLHIRHHWTSCPDWPTWESLGGMHFLHQDALSAHRAWLRVRVLDCLTKSYLSFQKLKYGYSKFYFSSHCSLLSRVTP